MGGGFGGGGGGGGMRGGGRRRALWDIGGILSDGLLERRFSDGIDNGVQFWRNGDGLWRRRSEKIRTVRRDL